jgi:riboflavin biosynthesis pyrimidine reductase
VVRLIHPAPGRDLSGSESELVAEFAEIYAYPDGTCVRANMIASVDGAISVDGRSGGLSGAADRLLFQVLRSLADVIVVGAGTARAEHYGPAARNKWVRAAAAGSVPPIAVVTQRLSLDPDSSLIRESEPPAIVLTTREAPAEVVAEVSKTADVVIAGEASVSVSEILGELTGTGRGYRKILVEGGPRLLGQFAAAGQLHELCVTTSPLLEGGHPGSRMLVAPGEPAREPTPLTLRSVIEDGGFLLCRYASQ